MRALPFLLLALLIPARADAETVTYMLGVQSRIEGFSAPESVLHVKDRHFVSNLGNGGDPTAMDGNGFISEIDGTGSIKALHAFPPDGQTLNGPKGMAVIGSVLYVADIDRVVGFSLDNGAQVFVSETRPSGAFLNDLAVLNSHALLVTDTKAGLLLNVDIKGGGIHEVAGQMPGANGVAVAPDGQTAFVNSLGGDFNGGPIYKVNLADKQARPHGAERGIFDGMALLADGRLLVSDWITLDSSGHGSLRLIGANGSAAGSFEMPSVSGPADFAIDPRRNRLWLPAMNENRILIFNLTADLKP